MKLQRAAIIGAGQVGTSLVMQILEKHPGVEIVALDVNPEIRQEFYDKLAACGFDEEARARVKFTTNPQDIVDPEIAVLATPISEFGNAVRTIKSRLTPETLVMDIGSVKEAPMEEIFEELGRQDDPDELDLRDNYMGGHIFNGNAGFGPNSASMDVFQSRLTDGSTPEAKPFFLVARETAKPGEEQRLTPFEQRAQEFVESIGSKPVFVSATFHDEIVGTLSHLEYVIVFALMSMPFMKEYLKERGQADPGGAVTAMLRIAQAHPDMWIAIFKDNHKNILKTAEHFRDGFSEVRARSLINNVQLVDELHQYAKDKPTPRVHDFTTADYQGYDLRFNTLVGLVSLGIAKNSMRFQEKTGQNIADVANPSYKDGLGFTAKASFGLSFLLAEHAYDVLGLSKQFETSFNNIVSLIRDMGVPEKAEKAEKELRKIIIDSGEDHKNLAQVYEAPASRVVKHVAAATLTKK